MTDSKSFQPSLITEPVGERVLGTKPPFITVLLKAHLTFPSVSAPICHGARLRGHLSLECQGNAKKMELLKEEGAEGLPFTHSYCGG